MEEGSAKVLLPSGNAGQKEARNNQSSMPRFHRELGPAKTWTFVLEVLSLGRQISAVLSYPTHSLFHVLVSTPPTSQVKVKMEHVSVAPAFFSEPPRVKEGKK